MKPIIKTIAVIAGWMLYFGGLAAMAAEEGKSNRIDIGLRYKDVIGSSIDPSTYDYVKKDYKYFPSLGLLFEQSLGEGNLFEFEGLALNEYTQQHRLGLDMSRLIRLESTYVDFFHNLRRYNIDTPAASSVRSTEVTNDYGRRYTDWESKATINLPMIPTAKVDVTYREQKKRGNHQGVLWTNCGACHFYTSTRGEDRLTRDVKAAVSATVLENVSVEYAFENRTMVENYPAEPYPADGGGTGAYKNLQGATKYDFVPNQNAVIHEAKGRIDLPEENTVSGGYLLNTHTDEDNKNTIVNTAYNVRLVNTKLVPDMAIAASYANFNSVNNVYYTYGTGASNNFVLPKSHATTAEALGLDLNIRKMGLDTSYYCRENRTTVRLKVDSETTDRTNAGPLAASSVDAKAHVSVVSKMVKDATIQARYTYNNTASPGYETGMLYAHKAFGGLSWNLSQEIYFDANFGYLMGAGAGANYQRTETDYGVMASFLPTTVPFTFSASYARFDHKVRNDLYYRLKTTKPYPQYIDYNKNYTDSADAISVGATYQVASGFQLEGNAQLVYSKGSWEAPSATTTMSGKTFDLSELPNYSKVDAVTTGFTFGGTYDLSKEMVISVSYLYENYLDRMDDTFNAFSGTNHAAYAGVGLKF